jgi:hypothetical protein
MRGRRWFLRLRREPLSVQKPQDQQRRLEKCPGDATRTALAVCRSRSRKYSKSQLIFNALSFARFTVDTLPFARPLVESRKCSSVGHLLPRAAAWPLRPAARNDAKTANLNECSLKLLSQQECPDNNALGGRRRSYTALKEY